MNKGLTFLGVFLLVVVVLAFDALFVVTPKDQALVFQFGRIVRAEQTPGLKFKLPFVQNVVHYDRRILGLDLKADQVPLSDDKYLDVDIFARYRISDPLEFYKSVRNEMVAQDRLIKFIISSMRGVLGRTTLAGVLSEERDEIMKKIRDDVALSADRLGIEFIDTRLVRADLPKQNSQAIFERMKSERYREAKEFRAQGVEQQQRIMSKADREKVVLLSEGEKEAQAIRGDGDRQATEIYAKAFGVDPEFYSFYRSMELYKSSLDSSTLVLSPQSELLKHFYKK